MLVSFNDSYARNFTLLGFFFSLDLVCRYGGVVAPENLRVFSNECKVLERVLSELLWKDEF